MSEEECSAHLCRLQYGVLIDQNGIIPKMETECAVGKCEVVKEDIASAVATPSSRGEKLK